jgi:hypothetical protein
MLFLSSKLVASQVIFYRLRRFFQNQSPLQIPKIQLVHKQKKPQYF